MRRSKLNGRLIHELRCRWDLLTKRGGVNSHPLNRLHMLRPPLQIRECWLQLTRHSRSYCSCGGDSTGHNHVGRSPHSLGHQSPGSGSTTLALHLHVLVLLERGELLSRGSTAPLLGSRSDETTQGVAHSCTDIGVFIVQSRKYSRVDTGPVGLVLSRRVIFHHVG